VLSDLNAYVDYFIDFYLLQANEQTNSNSTLIESNKINPSYPVESKQLLSNNVRARIRISLEIDLIATILLIAGIFTRLYRLEEPRSIV